LDGLTASSEVEDSPDSTPSERPLRSRQTGQNSIASESSLPQLRQVRWGSVLMVLPVLPRRLKLRREHGFPRRPAAARIEYQVPGSELRNQYHVPSTGAEPASVVFWQVVGPASLLTSRHQLREYHVLSKERSIL